MSSPIQDRVLALAGMAQALQQVRRIAETGQSDPAVVGTAIDSVFRIDAESPLAVYGDASALQPGLRLVRGYLNNDIDDPLLPKLALAVLQIERRFVADGDAVAQVLRGIAALAPAAERLGGAHPDILAGLGGLYAETISHLRPRVMVQGNPHYLGQAAVVAEIRSILLAALRSAVLWRQLGGSFWDFLLRRRDMLEAAGG